MRSQKRDRWYDTAQICKNGHVINAQMIYAPEDNQDYCSECGEPALSTCPQCHKTIRGRLHIEGIGSASSYEAPKFCSECGSQYPWTLAKLQAAAEMADLELGEEDAETVKANLDDLVRDTPRSEVAARKVERILTKASIVAGQGLRKLVVDIASETAAKILTGPGPS